MPGLADWAGFFTAEVGAVAALIGFLSVAISINLSRILAVVNLPNRAGEALTLLVGALVIASVALIPEQPAPVLGAEFLAIGLVIFVTPLVNQLRGWNAPAGVTTSQKTLRLATTALASLPFAIAGVLLISHQAGAFYWVSGGVIVALVAGVWNSWILLVEILR